MLNMQNNSINAQKTKRGFGFTVLHQYIKHKIQFSIKQYNVTVYFSKLGSTLLIFHMFKEIEFSEEEHSFNC